ncbi:DUF3718 domain-containing protein [Alteromonas sp. AMM-1]|uniref:DUF3718 domain-containing protein n=1 Tax=Alteromonas sp. AMM-1 TaxID=3394233 RepID=UPI0039A42C04
MKVSNRISAPLAIAALMSVSAMAAMSSAQAATMSAAMEQKLVAVCEAIKDDSRIALHKAVKSSGVSYRVLANGLVCNGQDMYSFAMLNNANQTGAIIAKRTNLAERSLTAKR